jgi:hypothetical protein
MGRGGSTAAMTLQDLQDDTDPCREPRNARDPQCQPGPRRV